MVFFSVTLSSVSSIISSSNITRKLFNSKNEFLSLKVYYKDKNLKLMVSLDTLVINLAYTDITTFLLVYYLNKGVIDTEKKLLSQKYNYINNCIAIIIITYLMIPVSIIIYII